MEQDGVWDVCLLEKVCSATKTAFVSGNVTLTEEWRIFNAEWEVEIGAAAMDPNALNAAIAALAANQQQQQQ